MLVSGGELAGGCRCLDPLILQVGRRGNEIVQPDDGLHETLLLLPPDGAGEAELLGRGQVFLPLLTVLVSILLSLALPPASRLFDRLAIRVHRDLLDITLFFSVQILHFNMALLVLLGVLVCGAVRL